jgi:DNA polymerase-1
VRLIFDIETNGLLDELDRIHCIWAYDLETGDWFDFSPWEIDQGVKLLGEARELIGHNILGFDVPALQKVFPDFEAPLLTDTLVLSRLLYPELRELDFAFRKKQPEFPAKLIGSHSLGAWGWRIADHKTDYEGGWASWNEEMHSYCRQDVSVTHQLYHRLMSKKPSEESIDLEHEVAKIIRRQEEYGFRFDTDAAAVLYSELRARHSALRDELRTLFPPWEVRTPFTPKRNNKTLGYVEGQTIEKVRTVEFNPDSRDHIALKLTEFYGWKPQAFTPEGKPKVDEAVLRGLEYPAAESLEEYLMLTKRLGQLSEGPQAWLKKVSKEGLIHGRVNTNGAVTGRMTHSHPNVAQVPSVGAPWGKECRSLFTARPGKVLVGCDASGLEGRCLAHFMGDSDFIRTILEGRKEDGTDLHSANARILGCTRDEAKTWFYAFIYGAGASKLGSILGRSRAAGAASRRTFMDAIPALGSLVRGVQRAVESRGYLKGLDGRRLSVRSSHSALNTLLQSAGALVMKQGLVLLDKQLQDSGWLPGLDYEFVANIHDEWQLETTHERAEDLGRMAVGAIRGAGEHFGFRCPLDGEYAIGRTWADTH